MLKKKKFKKRGSPIKPIQPLKQINPDAAGIDIGSESLYACVPADRDPEFVQRFSTFTAEIEAMSLWFKNCGIKTVAIEATGVYWVPVYDMLEAAGFAVMLVSPYSLKRRKKTDVLDCQWLQQMHSYGLLENSFRPTEEIRQWRTYVRLRERILTARSTDILHMQKALHQMNVQLDNVISDITGSTGIAILRAIVNGERDPQILAQFRDSRCKSSEEVIGQSLVGNYRAELLFELNQALDSYDFHGKQLEQCNAAIEQILKSFPDRSKQPLGPSKKKRQTRADLPPYDLRDHLYKACGVDLTAIDGLNVLTVQKFLSEVGVDLVKSFPTYKHFQSWLGTAPNRRITGEKVISSKTFKPNRAAIPLYLAAQALWNSQSPLGDKYRRLRARLGPQKAKIAMANNFARIIYVLLTKQVSFDQSLHAAHHEQNLKRAKRNLERKAALMGFKIIPIENNTSTVL
jgi:transposase